MLPEEREQVLFGETRDGIVGPLVDGWLYVTVLLAHFEILLDLLCRVV